MLLIEETNYNSPDKLKHQEYLRKVFSLTIKRYKEVANRILCNTWNNSEFTRFLITTLNYITLELNNDKEGLSLEFIDKLNDPIYEWEVDEVLNIIKDTYDIDIEWSN